jgi:hypothetical protein
MQDNRCPCRYSNPTPPGHKSERYHYINMLDLLYICKVSVPNKMAYRGNCCTALLILYLGDRWRWVASFKPRSLYPQGQPRHPLKRCLGWRKGWSLCLGEKSLGCSGILTPDSPTYNPVNISIELPRPNVSPPSPPHLISVLLFLLLCMFVEFK